MDERRRQRLEHDILQSLQDILLRDVSDERLVGVHFTRIKLSRDGSHATVFFETTVDEQGRQEILSAMESAGGYLRSQLSTRIRMRSTPALSFVHDQSGEKGDRTLKLIRELDGD